MSSPNLYVAFCKDRGTGNPRHWILVMAEEGSSSQTTWYHSTGGPTQDKPYSVVIEQKPFDSRGIEKYHLIGEISPKDKNKIKAAAQRTPAMRCQRWVVNVIEDLEKRSIVPEGTWSNWHVSIEVAPYSGDGAPGGSSVNSDGDCTTKH
ncbi:hypothetical protein FAUST_9446 [Fusarium austroamericanum]|uniref:Uncharacterized protein n=1 Tax=Fusarium austroamericanum TaxID=282268 RepID=A0AAN5Z2P9_FUSAU|nr:hypothetical protein FAUST_9446 [Fusarium austroamericanum]